MTGDDRKSCSSWRGSPTSSSSSRPRRAGRYKTELCRQFEEAGRCCYGGRCQFAHGRAELRSVTRHPKYKTDLCRTFHNTGLCPYGQRCHFIHNEDERQISADLEPPRAPPAPPIQFETEQRLLGLILLTVSVPRQLEYPLHHLVSSAVACNVEELIVGPSSLSRSCNSVPSSSRSSSRSASLGDIFSCKTLVD